MNRLAKLTRRGLVAGVLLSFLSTSAQTRAIGPQNQLIDPTFDAVVRVLYDNPGQQDDGDGYMNGTGTIIDHHNVGGEGVLCVLTADHVVSKTGTFGGALVDKPGIAFGNSAKDSGNSPYWVANPNVQRYGANGTSDYAVLSVKYGAYNPDYDTLVRDLIPASSFFDFTVIGYGNEGQLVDQFPPPGDDGYQSQGVYGTQRYMNDKVSTYATEAANFSAIGYTYLEAAIWYIDDPFAAGSADGSGTTFDADSGSPYFSSEFADDGANDIFYLTNNQFGVHTGTILDNNPPGSPAGYKAFGVENYGVALTQADIDWIHSACLRLIPEPNSLTLMLVAVVAAGWRRRSVTT